MDLQKVEKRNMNRAQRLVNALETAISQNQAAIAKAKAALDALMDQGTDLAEDLAAAKEYLLDLEQAKED